MGTKREKGYCQGDRKKGDIVKMSPLLLHFPAIDFFTALWHSILKGFQFHIQDFVCKANYYALLILQVIQYVHSTKRRCPDIGTLRQNHGVNCLGAAI